MSKYIYLSPELKISRIINGLWQVADMERDGKSLDLDQAAKALVPYVEAGLTTFDMADHYGSSELIAGILHKKYVPKDSIQLLTKWVPTPGKLTKKDVKDAVVLSLKRMLIESLLVFRIINQLITSKIHFIIGINTHEIIIIKS